MDREAIIAERLHRQRLSDPLTTHAGYMDLFALLQPVSPIAYSRPGDPPRLVHRTTFDDGRLTDRLRARRMLVKGRFLGGSIGYVLAQDLGCYARAFRRPLARPSQTQRLVLDVIRHAGPLTPRQIKEETGLLNKQIMPVLHRLQEASLVYEDQLDDDWERGWYDFASEWPQVDLQSEPWELSAAEVVLRFVRGHVFATFEQIKNWSQLAAHALATLIGEMERRCQIVPQRIEHLGEGWMLPEDGALQPSTVPRSVVMLHKADPLVRSHASELKCRFGEYEVLQYLLIDGEFKGGVLGHWRIGPHDVDDIVVELPAEEQVRRQGEILAAVALVYHPSHSRILRYAGRNL